MVTRFFKNPRNHAPLSLGKAPGELIDYDINDSIEAQVYLTSYNEQKYSRQQLDSVSDIKKKLDPDCVNWIQITGYDLDVIKEIGGQFAIHPLVLEDINERIERPKIQSTSEYCFITMNSYIFDCDRIKITSARFSSLLFKDLLITFHDVESEYIHPILNRLKQGLGKLRQNSSDYLAYVLLDGIVDQIFSSLQKTGEILDEIELDISDQDQGQDNILKTIHKIKHNLIMMRRGIWPLRELFGAILRDGEEHQHFSDKCNPFLRDLYDHAIQAAEINESLRDESISLIDLYLNSIANDLNNVMKILSIIGTIFLPLTFITSLYGMNFKDMPELDSPYGYPVIIFIMLTIAILMLFFFKKKKWL